MSILLRRPIRGHGRVTAGPTPFVSTGTRPALSRAYPRMGALPDPASPAYQGMDPSDPATYTRPWNPRPGMIAYLNYDGAQAQSRQPAGGLQRGKQQRRNGYRRASR